MLANTPAMLEAHYGVPMTKGVLNTVNTRLDAATIGFILDHAETKVLITDREFAKTMKEALAIAKTRPLVIDYDDPEFAAGRRAARLASTTRASSARAIPITPGRCPTTNGTRSRSTIRPAPPATPRAWSITTAAPHSSRRATCSPARCRSTRSISGPCRCSTATAGAFRGRCRWWRARMSACAGYAQKPIWDALADHAVTHLCGAPIVMSTILATPDNDRRQLDRRVEFFTAAAPPPEAVLAGMREAGFNVTHLYGLTETYGPAVVNDWNAEWDALDGAGQARMKARQGVRYLPLEDLTVVDPETMSQVPADGATLGEVMFRGNVVMKGYLKNPKATGEAFRAGWFHSGDLGVLHPDGYIQLKDRSKDIIISGGENISSIEVEDALYKHPAVSAAAVVAKPDEKWGETPCAFIELRDGKAATAAELIDWCREPPRALQGAADSCLRRIAEDVDRQDPEEQAQGNCQAPLTQTSRRGERAGSAPRHNLSSV